MNKVQKIVTARNTAFILGYPKDTAENSPTIASIDYMVGFEMIQGTYGVQFSDETFVEVKDVVEVWSIPETPEEEKAHEFSKLPFGTPDDKIPF